MSHSYSSDNSQYSGNELDPQKKADCIRSVANFSKVQYFHLMDKGNYNTELLLLYLKDAAPKIDELFKKIEALDKQDLEKEGKLFKHMIFTDLKSSNYGAKLLASAFNAKGYHPAFHAQGPGFGINSDEKLLASKSYNFGLLMSKKIFDRTMNVKFKKSILELYNKRPDNVHGDYIRFIILDQGFKEGIDLFDVKYIHLFEPLVVRADEKQAIGRGTRFCGQKELEFHPRYGWPLYVFRYEVLIPKEHQPRLLNAKQMLELYLAYANIDLRKIVFAAELEKASIEAAIDKDLTKTIHQFKIEQPPPILQQGGVITKTPIPPVKKMSLSEMTQYIKKEFSKFAYPKVVLENKCKEMTGGKLIQFTPTQDFIRHYFQPKTAYKGMLLWHSVGTGKTCTAIATATTSFEKEGYSILWVTRHTLKSDIWKNMFQQVCSLTLQNTELPKKIGSPMKYVSKNWMEPISYKQFSNMLLKKNKIYDEMVQRNGIEDPLRKTLIIIDEAHKLYSPTVVGSEKPNTDILEKMIHHSYDKSGKDSVRLLAMTATPYTEDGMEMIKLLNLLRDSSLMPTDFDNFAKKYALDNNGYFVEKGLKHFQDDISGYISYLNRSQDARNFAHPVIKDVTVELTFNPDEEVSTQASNESSEKSKERMVGKYEKLMKELKDNIKEEKKVIGAQEKNIKKVYKEKQEEVKQKANIKIKNDLEKIKEKQEDEMIKCNELKGKEKKECKDTIKKAYKVQVINIKKSKSEYIQKCMPTPLELNNINKESLVILEDEKAQIQGYIDMNKKKIKDWMEQQNKYKDKYVDAKLLFNDIKIKVKKERAALKKIKDKDSKKIATKKFRETVLKEFKEQKNTVVDLRFKMSDLQLKRKVLKIDLEKAKLGDVTQKTALQKRCSL